MDENLLKRHSETHFANIGYGYYTLLISVLYLVFLFLMKRYVKIKANTSKIVKAIYNLNPLIHLLLIFVALLIPFYNPSYSKPTVYFKRLGRLSYVLVSLNLLLMLRPNFLLSNNYTYTDFMPIHKWLSRFIVLVSLIHGILFLIWWKVKSSPTLSIPIKLQNKYNAVGLAISIVFVLLTFFSLGPFRRWNYTVFYLLHNLSNLSLIFLTPLHARPGVTLPYLIINVVILLLLSYQKIYHSSKVQLEGRESFKHHDGTNSLVYVKLERKAIRDDYLPATHIRISPYSVYNPLYWLLPSHPYTVISLPKDDYVELFLLEHISKRSFRLHMETTYTVINDFTPSIPVNCFSESNRICIACAGTGISFGLPLYRYFLDVLSSNQREIQYLKLIWVIKDKSQLALFENISSISNILDDDFFARNIEIFITTTSPTLSNTAEDNFELQDLDSEEDDMLNKYDFGSIKVGRRIDWITDLSSFVEHGNGTESTWMLACGPETFVKAAENFANKTGIQYASETYSF